MTRCLNLTKAGEYAIAALSRLALGGPASGRTSTPILELARVQNIPASFLSKILSQCSKAGLIHSRKGPTGGIALARPAEQISLLEIIEAVDGPLERDFCVFEATKPCPGDKCQVHCPLRRGEGNARQQLAGMSLAHMAASLSHKEALDGARVGR